MLPARFNRSQYLVIIYHVCSTREGNVLAASCCCSTQGGGGGGEGRVCIVQFLSGGGGGSEGTLTK